MTGQSNNKNLPSSFRDPDGFLLLIDGSIYRQINLSYKENYDHLMGSGLYEDLINASLLIPHVEINVKAETAEAAYKIIKPEVVPFISYPYEWCFSQLKHAALLTLQIQKIALGFGMTLKDSSAYNIQFKNGRPLLIDTLSFEKYQKGQPWAAYRQFCQHFLAPLAIMSYKDVRLSQLSRIYMDGVPLDLASLLLPIRTHFKSFLLSHIHLHARFQKHYEDKSVKACNKKLSYFGFLALIDNLESAVKKLKWKPGYSEWIDYYHNTDYTSETMQFKKKVVAEFLDQIKPKSVFDLGANTGFFSRIASDRDIQTVSFDIDPAAVEKNYLECMENQETNILPLLLDLSNPSPAIGWENEERMSFLERGSADMAFALALIHHLVISHNVPFKKIASFLSRICNSLVIEFVPKADSQVQRLLIARKDIFQDYTQEVFEQEFGQYFTIQNSVKIKDSERILYLLKRK
ncbi:MAG: class I SAM-dependent methyltransferase [Candidatus Omnitrophica bacterium]|nr:class I SAM-dependent methyltransferase [Candidatus Omnitrophota bacterium]